MHWQTCLFHRPFTESNFNAGGMRWNWQKTCKLQHQCTLIAAIMHGQQEIVLSNFMRVRQKAIPNFSKTKGHKYLLTFLKGTGSADKGKLKTEKPDLYSISVMFKMSQSITWKRTCHLISFSFCPVMKRTVSTLSVKKESLAQVSFIFLLKIVHSFQKLVSDFGHF